MNLSHELEKQTHWQEKYSGLPEELVTAGRMMEIRSESDTVKKHVMLQQGSFLFMATRISRS